MKDITVTRLVYKKFPRSRIILILMLVLLIAIGLGYALPTANTKGATSTTLESKWKGSYYNWQFKFKGYNGYGLCAYDSKGSAPVGASGSVTNIYDQNVIKVVYYVLYKQQGANLTPSEMSYTHVYLSYKLNGEKSLTDNAKSKLEKTLEWAKEFENSELPPEYESFKVYTWQPTGANSKKQPVVFFSYILPGQLALVKEASDPNTMRSGSYSLKGIEYTVYHSDRTTVAGKLITENDLGESNTLDLAPGDYYIKETTTPSETGFQINPAILEAKVISGNTTIMKTEGAAREEHIPAKVYVEKTMEGNEEALEPFEFEIINVNDNTIRYELITSVGRHPRSEEIEILAGTYIVNEKPIDGYQSLTEPYEFTVNPGDTYKIKWKNRMLHRGQLAISKSNLDGGDTHGFKFRVSGILFKKIKRDGVYSYITEDQMTEEKLIEKASLDENALIYNKDKYSLGSWKVNSNDIKAINEAALKEKNGDFKVRISNELISNNQAEYPSVPFDILIMIKLSNMIENSGEHAGKSRPGEDPISVIQDINNSDETEDDDIHITYNNLIDFPASRTRYLDSETGEKYTDIVLGVDNNVIDNIPYGRYTVTELMNEEQASKYHEEDGVKVIYNEQEYLVKTTKTKDITDSSTLEDYTFGFENIPKTLRVKLRKSSDYGDVSGITFQLKSIGITSCGIEYENIFTTDDNGEIDFGNLNKGTYILNELTFDKQNCINTYPLKGYSSPAIKFEVTGEEKGVGWIGGEPGNGGIIVVSNEASDDMSPPCTFVNKHYTKLYISKIDGDTGIFLPNVIFELRDEGSELVASFGLVRNSEGHADVDIYDSQGDIKGGPCFDLIEENQREYIVIYGLEEGKAYELREAEAPKAYTICEPVYFEFSDSMKLEIENYAEYEEIEEDDEEPCEPSTNDNIGRRLILSIIILCASGLLLLLISMDVLKINKLG